MYDPKHLFTNSMKFRFLYPIDRDFSVLLETIELGTLKVDASK